MTTTESRLRNLTNVLNRVEVLQKRQQRLEDERDAIVSRLTKFKRGDTVIFEDREWEVYGTRCRFSAGVAQVWLVLRRGASRINPKQTREIPVREQFKCQLKK